MKYYDPYLYSDEPCFRFKARFSFFSASFFSIFFLLFVPVLLSAQTGTTVAGGNGAGSGANQFSFPHSVALDAAGNIYVADRSNHRVQKWVPGASSGITVAGGNGVGAGANQLGFPEGVAVDAAGNVYVADTKNNRIQKWAPGAISGTTVAGGNGFGSGANQLKNPFGVAVDAAGNIYVADTKNNRIQKWTPGATSGTTVAGGNGSGTDANQLSIPYDVALDAAGNIYVADRSNQRIQKWAPSATSGVTVAGGNGAGTAPNQLNYPEGVTVDGGGNVYIADSDNHRIQRWASGATTGITVAGGNGLGPGANQLNNPTGVEVDAAGDIYIADYGNNRIQKWAAVLPVRWLQIDAYIKNGKTLLTWQTASEVNNRGFDIERSTDGRAWVKIGFVKGAGNSNAKQFYTYEDKSPLSGINYYRLAQVDFDGKIEYSTVFSVCYKQGSQAYFRIAPNPATTQMHILWDTPPSENIHLRIFNINGHLISEKIIKPNSNTSSINVSSIPKGLYLLETTTGNKTMVEMFMKE